MTAEEKANKLAIMKRTAVVRKYFIENYGAHRIYTDKLKDGVRSVKAFGSGAVWNTREEAQAAAADAAKATGAKWKAVKRQGCAHYIRNVGYTIRAYV